MLNNSRHVIIGKYAAVVKRCLNMGIHIGVAETVSVFAFFLCQIHCGIGLFDQVFYVLCIGGIQADTDAGCGMDFVTFKQKWMGECIKDFVCNNSSIERMANFRKNNSKFVTTRSGNRITFAYTVYHYF